ncbi:MAG: hypothetical protein ABFD13_00485 [Candidatus Cryosericum sp.]|nr:hypothetical protein [bacterium]
MESGKRVQSPDKATLLSISEVMEITQVCRVAGHHLEDVEVSHAFASDLMSDVLATVVRPHQSGQGHQSLRCALRLFRS